MINQNIQIIIITVEDLKVLEEAEREIEKDRSMDNIYSMITMVTIKMQNMIKDLIIIDL
jgi:hypothetical protein